MLLRAALAKHMFHAKIERWPHTEINFVSRHVKLGRKTKDKDNMDQHKGGLGEEGGQGTCASVIVPSVTGLASFHEHFDHFCVSCPSSKMQAAMSTFCT